MSTPSFYAIIPANVRYCKELEPNAKLLYGEITALAQKEGYCWASNGYFAELYDVDERSIRNWLKSLKDLGFIEVDIIQDGIQIQRKIWVSPEVKRMFAGGKNLPEGRKKSSGGVEKNFRHSNTGITTEEKVVCNPEAGIDKKKLQEDERKRILEETKMFNDLPTEIEKDHANGGKTKVILNDLFLASIRSKRDWKTSEIQDAWKILIDYAGPIRDAMRFIEGTIDKRRKLKQAEYLNQRNSEPCKTQTTNQTFNDSKQNSSVNDIEEPRSVQWYLDREMEKDSQTGLKKERVS